MIDADGWPDDLRALPGVGRYTAAAVAAQADGADAIGIEVNIRRVCERVRGERLVGRGSGDRRDRDRVTVARSRPPARVDGSRRDGVRRARTPLCGECPIVRGCATKGPLPNETKHRQAAYEGSFRQRRGNVMARLREGPTPRSSSTAKRSRHSSTTASPKSRADSAHLPKS